MDKTNWKTSVSFTKAQMKELHYLMDVLEERQSTVIQRAVTHYYELIKSREK